MLHPGTGKVQQEIFALPGGNSSGMKEWNRTWTGLYLGDCIGATMVIHSRRCINGSFNYGFMYRYLGRNPNRKSKPETLIPNSSTPNPKALNFEAQTRNPDTLSLRVQVPKKHRFTQNQYYIPSTSLLGTWTLRVSLNHYFYYSVLRPLGHASCTGAAL